MRPVSRPDVYVEQEVINEGIDIDLLSRRLVVGGDGEISVQRLLETIPFHGISFAHFSELGNDVVGPLPSLPGIKKVFIDALGGVVVSFVGPIDVKGHLHTLTGHLPHVAGKSSNQLIDHKRIGMVIHASSKNDLLISGGRRARNERVGQFRSTVVTPEIETEGVLAEGQATVGIVAIAYVVAALNPKTGIDLKNRSPIGKKVFH